MSRPDPVTVYLDTQDYSRFGKVIDGSGKPQDEELFERLMELRARGLARFVYSATILSELLQYEPEYDREALAKARAVEQLCGGYTLVWLPRLIETQAGAFARSIGLEMPDAAPAPIRSGNEWFPRVSGQLDNFKETLRQRLDGAARNYGPLNRAQRRAVGANKRDGKLADATRAIVPEFADKYGISAGSVERVIIPLLKGKCTGDEASRLLFAAVAKPSAFIHAYFKVEKRDKSVLNFIVEFGRTIEKSLIDFRRNAEPFMAKKEHAEYLRALLKRDIGRLAATILGMTDTDEAEQGVTGDVLRQITDDPAAIERVPCCAIATQVMLGYLEQTVAIHTTPSKIEHSFGGDLIHLLYIDCVDIWRTDVRFAELVRQRLRDRAYKIQPRLHGLPEHIIAVAEARGLI
jgi:hypothetical protein